MRIFQAFFFLFFGIGLSIMAWRGIGRGWLPFGTRGLAGRFEPRREEQPLAFWMAFAVYVAAGAALTVYALMLFIGAAAPLPLR